MTDNHSKKNGPGGVSIPPLRRPLSFSMEMSGNKSIANRALLLAGVALGDSLFREIPESEDVAAALSALAAVGVDTAMEEGGVVRVRGRGLAFPERSGTLDIGSSGTVGRFLPGLLAAAGGDWRIVASTQLAARPLEPLLEVLGGWGARLSRENPPASFPLTVAARGLTGGKAVVSAVQSSQFASGVLLASPLAARPADISIRGLEDGDPYVDMTLAVMRRFGIAFDALREDGGLRVLVPAPQTYRPVAMTVEADYNNSLYFLALPLLVGGSAAVTNLSEESLQPGRAFLDVIRRLGGTVAFSPNGVTVGAGCGRLRGGFAVDMRRMAEMFPTLGVLALFADGPITMTNLLRVRGHETDRLAAMAERLRQVGARVESGADWLRVDPLPGKLPPEAEIDSAGDPRIAMSFTLLGVGGNGIRVRNPGVVAKTFPDFWDRLGTLGVGVSWY